ncbi:MAG: 4Fe-4S dicluster domain-containing protein [Myxococcota bacterium]
MSRAAPWIAAVAAGLSLGAVAGRVSFARIDDPRPTCGTCHHGQTRLEDAPRTAPHRTDLGVGCHRCHVLPVGAYVQALGAEVGVQPTWDHADPVLGGQTCLGCHVGRGRGAIDCDRCHVPGEDRPDLRTGCVACHTQRPMHPHDGAPCTACHVEAAMGHEARTEALMRAKLHEGPVTDRPDDLQAQRDDVARALGEGRSERLWGMVIDPDRCTGCMACTAACKAENNLPPGIAYLVVLEEVRGTVPHTRRRFTPRPCMHCAQPSCVAVCPVSATFLQPDGAVVMDYEKCIGCRYCMTNCPYGARSFDFGEHYGEGAPGDAGWEARPSPEYQRAWVREGLGSPIGNVRKCHLCLHRVREGLLPACVEACPTGAIAFGDLANPHGPVGVAVAEAPTTRLREELGNEPKVFYRE